MALLRILQVMFNANNTLMDGDPGADYRTGDGVGPVPCGW